MCKKRLLEEFKKKLILFTNLSEIESEEYAYNILDILEADDAAISYWYGVVPTLTYYRNAFEEYWFKLEFISLDDKRDITYKITTNQDFYAVEI
jgi:hypothetical protein